MIDEATFVPPTRPPFGPGLWRRWWFGVLVLAVLVTAAVLSVRAEDKRSPRPAAAPIREESTTVPPTRPSRSTVPAPAELLQLPGSVPTHGSESFQYGRRTGLILGREGSLLRFRVGVEDGTHEDVDDFADQVEATLGDRRSWIGGGLRLQLVAAGQPYDFTVYLATRDTAEEMCLRQGTDIRAAGVPYTSCRTPGRAIINLDRWRRSAAPYLAAKVPLAVYRQYVVNHEVGHELGHHHEGCPKVGGPAPVMVQQTLTLRGCVPYAWPRIGARALTGPPV